MNILFISQYFYPENFKGNDLVFGLAKRGHKILVITGKPNYPKGEFYEGYGYFKKYKEEINGVSVIRLPLIPRKTGKIWLALNYISFYISILVFYLFRSLKFEFDIILTQQLSPVTSSFPGMWFKKKFKKPLITWVLDLWPDSLTANSNIKKGLIINCLEKLVRKLYLNSDLLLVSSLSFKKEIETKIGNSTPIEYFPNWAEDLFSNLNLGRKEFGDLPNGFNIVFAGNIGEAQDLDCVMRAAIITKLKPNINWIFVGEGRFKERLLKILEEYKLTNVYTFPGHDLEYMPSLYSKADVMLLTLKGGSLISATVPAKLQSYMSSSKVILGMIDGEANQIIVNSDCGLVCNAGDYNELAKNAIKLSEMSKNELELKSKNALIYYNKYFNRNIIFNKIEEILLKFVNN